MVVAVALGVRFVHQHPDRKVQKILCACAVRIVDDPSGRAPDWLGTDSQRQVVASRIAQYPGTYRVHYDPTAAARPGIVVRESPAPGEVLGSGATVDLTIADPTHALTDCGDVDIGGVGVATQPHGVDRGSRQASLDLFDDATSGHCSLHDVSVRLLDARGKILASARVPGAAPAPVVPVQGATVDLRLGHWCGSQARAGGVQVRIGAATTLVHSLSEFGGADCGGGADARPTVSVTGIQVP